MISKHNVAIYFQPFECIRRRCWLNVLKFYLSLLWRQQNLLVAAWTVLQQGCCLTLIGLRGWGLLTTLTIITANTLPLHPEDNTHTHKCVLDIKIHELKFFKNFDMQFNALNTLFYILIPCLNRGLKILFRHQSREVSSQWPALS